MRPCESIHLYDVFFLLMNFQWVLGYFGLPGQSDCDPDKKAVQHAEYPGLH